MKLDETSSLYRLSMLCETTPPKNGCDVLIRATFSLLLAAFMIAGLVILGGGLLVMQGMLFNMISTWTWAAEVPQTPGEAIKLAMLGVPVLATMSLLVIAVDRFFTAFPKLARLAQKGLMMAAIATKWTLLSGIAAVITGGLIHMIFGLEPAGAPESFERIAALAMPGVPVLVVGAAAAYVATRVLKPLCLKIELPG